jgi:hypothetical protein
MHHLFKRSLLPAASLLAILLLLAAACADDSGIKDARTITVEGAFTFKVPGDMSGVDTRGIDSIAGAFAGPSIKLEYDYGAFSDPLGNDSSDGFKLTLLTIDGHEARIERFQDPSADASFPLVAAIHFPDLGNGNLLTMYARSRDEDAQDVAMDIFRSIRFIEAES